MISVGTPQRDASGAEPQTGALSDPILDVPLRPANSVRRTSHLDMAWPGGFGTDLIIAGRARDLVTDGEGVGRVVAEAEVKANMGTDRTVSSIELTPWEPGLDALVGAQAGRGFRKALANSVPATIVSGRPGLLLLDDLAPASLIAGFAWRQHAPYRELLNARHSSRRSEGTCIVYRPGSETLEQRNAGQRVLQNTAATHELPIGDDPDGWHLMETPPVGVAFMRRQRRMDVTIDGKVAVVDAMFRDNTWSADGTVEVVHEYQLAVEVDLEDNAITRIAATPRVLPYADCPMAAANISRLVGRPIGELRSIVMDILGGIEGCTHLNYMLRALTDIPALIPLVPLGA